MILGIGIDIIDMRRIQRLYDLHKERFLNRIFTSYEKAYCLSKKQTRIKDSDETTLACNSFAKMFAAKEAALKAIGNTHNIDWHELEVRHEDSGRPKLVILGVALENLLDAAYLKLGKSKEKPYITINTHLSLSDDVPYAIAHVMLEIE